MTDELKHEQLDRVIDGVIARGEFASTGDEELDALARLACGLRGLPDPEQKARIRDGLLPGAQRGLQPAFLPWLAAVPVLSWFQGQRIFLAGGSSCGLMAGTCCLIGAFAHVTGLASAAAATAFIDSTLPYFVAISVVSMAAWLIWRLREQGITLVNAGRTLRRHGLALATSYAGVFVATMALSMAMGLY